MDGIIYGCEESENRKNTDKKLIFYVKVSSLKITEQPTSFKQSSELESAGELSEEEFSLMLPLA